MASNLEGLDGLGLSVCLVWSKSSVTEPSQTKAHACWEDQPVFQNRKVWTDDRSLLNENIFSISSLAREARGHTWGCGQSVLNGFVNRVLVDRRWPAYIVYIRKMWFQVYHIFHIYRSGLELRMLSWGFQTFLFSIVRMLREKCSRLRMPFSKVPVRKAHLYICVQVMRLRTTTTTTTTITICAQVMNQ